MMCHVLGATLMSEKSKSILFNYLKPSIRGDLPGDWTGESKNLLDDGEKKV